MFNSYTETTLEYDEKLCNNCGMCSNVCPHGVYEHKGKKAQLVNELACMECGACQLNCPTGAITVESGVGCAYAMMWSALTGKEEVTCGCDDDSSSCCAPTTTQVFQLVKDK